MKTALFLLSLALLGGRSTLAATYYLAANGDDSRTAAQAQNPATPWQSLAKLNASMAALQPGDQVLLRRGDTFRGQLFITRSGSAGSPLTFGAYGPAADAAPVINGSAPLSGWTSVGANVWEAPCPSAGTTVTGVYAVGGRALPLGRYPNLSAPNRGYLSINSHVGSTQLTSAALAGSWVGGTAVTRGERWILDRAAITAQSGGTLTLGPPENGSPYGLKDGWGFFIQNHPATLDQAGEWWFDAAAKKIRLYATARPADGTLEATTGTSDAVSIRNQQHLTLENLTITHPLLTGLAAESVSHFIVRGVRVLGAGQNGVLLNGTSADVLFENNFIEGPNSNGMLVENCTGFTFRNNTLKKVGLVAGRGGGGDGNHIGFYIIFADQVLLENNTLDSLGYVGLTFLAASNVVVRRNVVSNYCRTVDDGGAITTWNGNGLRRNNVNQQILENIVFNAVGAPEGTDNPDYIPANGIYTDDCSQNVTIRGNTAFNCRQSGIFIHNSNNSVVDNNTCYNNATQLLMQYTPVTSLCPIRANTVTNNIFVAPDPAQSAAQFETPDNDLGSYGSFDNNVYARPFAPAQPLRLSYSVNGNGLGGPVSLADWQTTFGKDANSRLSPVAFRSYRVNALLGNQLLTNSTFDANINTWGSYSSSGHGAIAWDNTTALGSGGALRVSFPNFSQPTASVQVQSALGSLASGRSYVVRFTARVSGGIKPVQVFLEQANPPYGELGADRVVVAVGPTAQRYEAVFTTRVGEPTANLTLETPEDNRTLWFDNVTVQEATVALASVADSIRFEYNATNAPRTVALPAGARYVDARNAAYSGSLTLAPFASVVLLRTGGVATPLPVELTEFTAQATAAGDADLAWNTASERNNSHFAVERSADGKLFAEIGRVPGRGTGGPARYAWRDAGAARQGRAANSGSSLYYRLRQVDIDGRASYSPVRTVAFGAAPAALLWPNPSAGPATLDLRGFTAGPCRVELLDATGRAVRRLTLAAGRTHPLDLSGLPAGVFLLRVAGQAGQASQRVVRE